MKYKYFFFDFDGMLVDSYDHIVSANIEAIKINRGITLDKKEFYETCKVSMATAYKKYNFVDEEKKLAVKIEADPNFAPIVKPFKESLDILKAIKKSGGYIYIYTNRENTLELYLAKFGFDKYVDGFYKKTNKPNPTMLINAINDLKLNRSECIMIGDRKLDVDTGIGANVDTLLFDSDNLVTDKSYTYKISKLESIYKTLDINV